MILEMADLRIAPETEAEFLAAVAKAVPLFRRAEGCLSMRLDRVIETPGLFRLVVGWESLDHHMVTFRGSEDFAAWRALVGGFFVEAPQVVHTETATAGFPHAV